MLFILGVKVNNNQEITIKKRIFLLKHVKWNAWDVYKKKQGGLPPLLSTSHIAQ